MQLSSADDDLDRDCRYVHILEDSVAAELGYLGYEIASFTQRRTREREREERERVRGGRCNENISIVSRTITIQLLHSVSDSHRSLVSSQCNV